MIDIFEAYLNLVLPPSFWVVWDIGRHYVFMTGVLILLGAFLMGLIFLTVSLYQKQKNFKSQEAYFLKANQVMKQNWICFNPKTCKIESVSPSFSNFVALPDLELSFESLLLVVDSEERFAFRGFILDPKNSSSCTTVSLWLDSRRYFRVTRIPLSKGALSEQKVLLVWQDVTALKDRQKSQADRARHLEEKNQCLIGILDSLPWPIWVLNKKDKAKIVYCNQVYADALDMSKESITEKDIRLSEHIEDQFSQGVQKHFNLRGARKLLELRELPLSTPPDHLLRMAYDRTEEQSLRKKLEHYLSLYREVLETLSAGVVIYGPDKKVQFYNHSYIQMFGMDDRWLSTGPYLGEVLDDLNRRRLLSDQSDYPTYRKREINMVSGLLSPFQELMYLPDQRTIRKITAPHPAGGIFYVFEDVTTSLDLERRFNTHLQVQKSTLDNLFEGIAVFGSDNRLKFTNPAFDKLWNWSPEQAESSDHLADLLNHAKDRVAYEGDWETYKDKLIGFLTDRVPKTRKIPMLDKRVFEFSYTPLPDGSHLFGFHDMTSITHQSDGEFTKTSKSQKNMKTAS